MLIQALGVFGLCQLYSFVQYLRARLSAEHFGLVVRSLVAAMATGMIGALVVATALGSTLLLLLLLLL